MTSAGEAEIDMVRDLNEQILSEVVIPAELKLSIILNCYKGKGDVLDRRSYMRLKLTDQSVQIFEGAIEKLISERADKNEM